MEYIELTDSCGYDGYFLHPKTGEKFDFNIIEHLGYGWRLDFYLYGKTAKNDLLFNALIRNHETMSPHDKRYIYDRCGIAYYSPYQDFPETPTRECIYKLLHYLDNQYILIYGKKCDNGHFNDINTSDAMDNKIDLTVDYIPLEFI